MGSPKLPGITLWLSPQPSEFGAFSRSLGICSGDGCKVPERPASVSKALRPLGETDIKNEPTWYSCREIYYMYAYLYMYIYIYIYIDYILQCRFIPTWSRFSNWKQHVWSLDMSGLWLVISGFLKRGITRTWWLAIGNNLDRTLGQRMARRHAASLQKSEPQTEMGLDWRRHETSMTHGYQPVYPSMRSKL